MAGEKDMSELTGRLLHYLHLLDRLLAGGDKCPCGACIVDLATVLGTQVTFPIDMRGEGEQDTKRGPVDPRRRHEGR